MAMLHCGSALHVAINSDMLRRAPDIDYIVTVKVTNSTHNLWHAHCTRTVERVWMNATCNKSEKSGEYSYAALMWHARLSDRERERVGERKAAHRKNYAYATERQHTSDLRLVKSALKSQSSSMSCELVYCSELLATAAGGSFKPRLIQLNLFAYRAQLRYCN